MENYARLDEFDKAEMFDIARVFKPDVTWEEFSETWDRFQQEKARRTAA